MKPEQQFARAINIAVVGLLQFLALCPVAMLLYPPGFSISSDYLSALGCFRSLTSVHAWIFSLSLIGLGAGLICLFRALYRIRRNDPGELLVCGVTGMFTGAFLILIALLPLNVFPAAHNIAMAGWLFSTVVTLVFWLDWQRRRTQENEKSTSVAQLGVYAIVGYPIAVLLAWGPAMQKIVVVLAIAWLGYFCLQLRQVVVSGEVHQWLVTSSRKPRRERPVKVRYVEFPGSADGQSSDSREP